MRKNEMFVELMKQVLESPSYNERGPLREAAKRAAAPVVADLQRQGIDVDELNALRSTHPQITLAIPLLIKWLPSVTHPWVRMTIVRRLSIPAASGYVGEVLIDEFNKITDPNDSLKWAIGNALSITSTARNLAGLLKIAKAKRNGRSRQMIVMGLSQFDTSGVRKLLLRLAGDEDVKSHAVAALGSLRAKEALPLLRRMVSDKDSRVRNEAKAALKKIEGKKPRSGK